MSTAGNGKGNGKFSQEGGKQLVRGAALLGGAALISKLIGTLQKIPLQNLAGDEVFGLYSAVYALAVMWMTLAAAGVPTAVSVLVAEYEADGDAQGAQRVLRWSIGLLCASGLLAFAALQAFAEPFARWMGAPDAAAAVRTSSIALLFAPAAAVLRGYKQGQMRMLRPAVSQIAEQSLRVAFMLLMLFWALGAGWQAPGVAAAVHGGLAAGAIAGLAVMLWPARRTRHGGFWVSGMTMRRRSSPSPSPSRAGAAAGRIVVRWPESRRALLKRIAGVALPVAGASVAAPLFGLIDAFSIPRLLGADDTAAASGAMAAFGVYNRGIALLQLVLVGAAGAAAALVPAMTASRRSGDDDAAADSAAFTLRLAWWFGGAASVGLALLAAPIDITLFADDSGSRDIVLLAPAAAFGTLQAVGGSVLQGRGDLRSPAVNLAVAAAFKLALNLLLVPAYGIAGAAAGMAAAYGAAALLNALSLRQKLALPGVRLATAWRPAAALAAMAAAVALCAYALGALTGAWPARAGAIAVALPCVAVGAAVFAAGLAATGAIGPAQWRALPGFSAGSRPDVWLLRIRQAASRHVPPPTSREG